MKINKLETSKQRLSQAFRRLETLIEQKLQEAQLQAKSAMAENYRLEKHLKTINNRYISLQTVTKEAIENCDKMLVVLNNLMKNKNGHS